MRRLVDGVIAAGSIAIAAVVVWTLAQRVEAQRKVAVVEQSVRDFGDAIRLHAASEGTALTGRGWPATIDPAWFGDSPPRNILLSPDRPWVQIASADDANLLHPYDRVAATRTAASFWYNPYQGVVRARVAMEVSDKRTLELYNRVNGTSLDSILAPARPMAEEEPSETVLGREPPPRLTQDELMDPTRPDPATTAVPETPDGGR